MLTLNPDQEAAAAAFAAFMVSNDREFVISGPAGTGKTTLLRHLMASKEHIQLAQLLNAPVLPNWSLTATTNKAAEVLQQATDIEASTIHSFLGLRVQNDFKTGKTKLSRTGNADVVRDTLIVVDECSMVDRDLYKYIDQCTFNCKLLYVGDHCQMAPVMEDLSPVFANNSNFARLETVVRSQHTPAITALCTQLRQTVETGVFAPIAEVPGVIDYLDPAGAEREIRATFLTDSHPDARILCYTNAKVVRFNDYLREQRALPPTFTEGEYAVSNAMAMGWYADGSSTQARLRVEEEIQIVGIQEALPFRFDVNGQDFELPIYLITTAWGGQFRVAQNPTELREVIKMVGRAKDWPTYFQLKEQIADLRPRDACTVYKAQGSTYRTVFVDLADIGTCTNAAQAARMLYVACSRPTHRICFIGRLPPRFQGV